MSVEMSVSDAPKTERLEIRMSAQSKAIITSVCEMLGISLTNFATYVLVKEAMEVMGQVEVFKPSLRDAKAMLEALENPPAPNEALRALMQGQD